ncbi:reverse transcriptase [Phytophthora megakarya]|uniref:Reverse transcriptase n=1 Tax=Phytophthora megakarya TaxID=4795 RepID=A0A225V3F9_9STRA|nr:reverse transcriptase [Phytophthora megakarya]
MLENLYRRRLVLCGDSNLVIRQVRGEIDCKAPGLTLLKRKALDRLRKWSDHELVHVKRDWNGSADSLASAALQRQGGIEVQEMPGYQVLVTLNRLDEILIPKTENPVDLIREIRVDWIKQAQEVEVWIASMKKYLSGSIADLTQAEARSYGKIAADYEATYPFQIIAMDHIPSLPRSHKGNTELLIWVDLFPGYVIAKASSSRSAQTVAESYEECVFRRFGASEMIRHDREPGFMSDFFRAFNKILGQWQRATMAYRPQANGTAERMVQTATRALKMYVRDLDQKDWDEYAEGLTFAINTAHDRIRGDTPHYWVHGWDPRSTLEATLPVGFAEKINEFSVELEIAGTGYQIFPVVHVSKLKLVKDFPDLPRAELTVDEADRLDFDEILLPEDGWAPDLGADKYEVERISDVRRYDDPTWVDGADLNCGAILNAFLRERANRNSFNVMQSHEEM